MPPFNYPVNTTILWVLMCWQIEIKNYRHWYKEYQKCKRTLHVKMKITNVYHESQEMYHKQFPLSLQVSEKIQCFWKGELWYIKKDFRNRKAKQADSIQESEETQQWLHRNESCIRGLENNEICIAGSSVGYKKIKSRDFNLSVFRNHLSIWIFKHSLDNFDLQLRLRAT